MVPSAPNSTPNPHDQHPRTGSLEDVFRQKFAEAEVTPRASLWEQLDHELLVQQNDTYRRRLAVHRWVAAACLLLLLGGGGWATWRQWAQNASAELAAQASGNANPSAATADARATLPAGARSVAGPVTPGTAASEAATATGMLAAAGGATETATGATAYPNSPAAAARLLQNALLGAPAGTPAAVGFGFNGSLTTEQAYANLLGSAFGDMPLRAVRVSGFGSLAGRPDTLKPALLTLPQAPAGQAQLAAASPEAQESQLPTKLWRRLRLGGSYAASSYNPNINFSQSEGRVKADPVTVALRNYYQDDAEQEYRRNLRAGLSQRVALAATFALNDRWAVTAGAEVAEHRATSATTYGFLDGKQQGRQAADLFRPASLPPSQPETRATSYRYRTASVPVGVRYGSTKPGVSLYAKVGAAVSVLLSSRSELEGSPEATRTYTVSSAESPYRQVLTSARAGAGVRYQPTDASWNVAVGPTAEVGLTTLNASPTQRLLRQSRPYSVGVEASVEFGPVKASPVGQ
ncbi:hypothetical protein [Hymenobacter weizhouensis]|uniref:hypothetical protein n=1 Tax=Hymenobacter sp. YIM 151500-1 TaxID=2987689 RepID=UPI0022270FAD|nr:hypothetical protein [Hymenobacter sp. YIM 151500-1]UYZ62834.1 hypothetical protein OIS53_17775 [Hymenobacter sp. YIM 151500-1]